MTAASAHCRQKHRKTALSILKKTLGAGTVLVPYPHCPWCSPVCEIVFLFFKTATAGAGFAVLLHPHPSHVQKHIPACPDQEFDYI